MIKIFKNRCVCNIWTLVAMYGTSSAKLGVFIEKLSSLYCFRIELFTREICMGSSKEMRLEMQVEFQVPVPRQRAAQPQKALTPGLLMTINQPALLRWKNTQGSLSCMCYTLKNKIPRLFPLSQLLSGMRVNCFQTRNGTLVWWQMVLSGIYRRTMCSVLSVLT